MNNPILIEEQSGDNTPVVFHLNPGKLLIAEHPMMISTLLGSCVSVTFFHSDTRIGAICHGLLPFCQCGHECHGQCSDCFKYINCSIRYMTDYFSKQKIPNRQIQVKLFGGSDMFATRNSDKTVGWQNIQVARDLLHKAKLHIRSADVGGTRGRKIIFNTLTGEVLLKRLQKTEIYSPSEINPLNSNCTV